MNKLQTTNKQVIDIIEKYREKLGIAKYKIDVNDYQNKFSVTFKNKYNKEMDLKVDFKNNRFTFQKYYSDWEDFYFEEIGTFKILVEFIEELNKIDFMKLSEFTQYVQKQREKQKLQEDLKALEKQQEELAEQIRKIRGY